MLRNIFLKAQAFFKRDNDLESDLPEPSLKEGGIASMAFFIIIYDKETGKSTIESYDNKSEAEKRFLELAVEHTATNLTINLTEEKIWKI
jgi:hypothetical protein